MVTTNAGRSGVDYFGLGWGADCNEGGFFHLGDELGNFPLTPNGVFGASFTNDYPFGDGSGKASYAYTVDGKLGNGSGSGKFTVHRTESDASGATTSTCNLDNVRWSVTQ